MVAKAKLNSLLGSVALAALAAALHVPDKAMACTAEAVGGGVEVTCAPGDEAYPFATSYYDDEGSGFYYDGEGDDVVNMLGGVVMVDAEDTPVVGDPGDEVFLDSTDGTTIETLGGADEFNVNAGTIGSDGDPVSVFLGAGADTFTMTGGTLHGSVFGQGGGNTYDISGGTIQYYIYAGSQNDTVTVSGSADIQGEEAEPDAIGLEDGDDTFTMTGGHVGASVSGNDGRDEMTVSGGTIDGDVSGNAGRDTITVNGGTIHGDVLGGDNSESSSSINEDEADMVIVHGGRIEGDIDSESVYIYGGTILGDVTGLTGNTLVINSQPQPNLITFRDGVVFSGVNAVGEITDSFLTSGTQNFDGFSSLTLTDSSIRFEDSTQVIDNLVLTTSGDPDAVGSLLISFGSVSIEAQGSGYGNMSLTGSTLNLINSNTSDTFTLGGLTLQNATIAVDVNQATGESDLIVANGPISVLGTNIIYVNLLGTPDALETIQIPILSGSGDPISGTFAVEGISGAAATLYQYSIIQGPGGLFLLAEPNASLLGALAGIDGAIGGQTAETALSALAGISDDAIENGLGLDGGGPTMISPSFGVFASGQFARVNHDGFDISGGGLSFAGPSFTTDDFSAAMSLDFNAAKHFQMDQQYGLNLGVFGGYASTDLDLGSFGALDSLGSARNKSGMAGAYGLFRKQTTYLLVSGSVFWGNTDVWNNIEEGGHGSYDTLGYAVTASAGRIFALSDKLRFDLRGGILGVSFEGDPFTDSLGIAHGKSKVSFGALKFEPGIYADYVLENGMVMSPYLRGELQQRFAYKNTTSAAGTTFDFDDADFSAALSAGFNLKMSQTATVSAELRGKTSSDSTTVAAKLGLKVAF